MYILKQNLLCCLILSFFSFQQNKILWSADTNSAWGFLLEIHFQKNFDSMFSRNFYFRIGVKVLLFFPWRGENRPQPALLAKPLQKSNKMAKKKKKVFNFRKSLPFLYQIGFSGSICKHLENGFEGSWTRHTLNLLISYKISLLCGPYTTTSTSLTKTMTRSFVLDLQLLLLSRTFMPMEWLNTWMGKTTSQELGIIRIIISVIIITNSHKNGFILQHSKKKKRLTFSCELLSFCPTIF